MREFASAKLQRNPSFAEAKGFAEREGFAYTIARVFPEAIVSESPIAVRPDDAPRRPQPRRRGRDGGNRGGGRPSIAVSGVLALTIAGFAAAGWFILHQQDQLKDNEQALAEAGERLRLLEERLRMTDETMTEAGKDTNEQLTFWESEVRKLWDVTNKRNRKWIQDNQAALKRQTSSIAGVQSTLKELKSDVGRVEVAFDQQREMIDKLATIETQVRQLVSAQRDLVDRVNISRQVTASLKAGLEPQVREHEEAIAANDAHRRQLNASIARLGTRLDAIERQLGQP